MGIQVMHAAVYQPRTTPYAHQSTALARIAERPSRPSPDDVFAFFMEMGTGKSWVALTEWAQRVTLGDLRGLLVVAPNGVHDNWARNEVPKHIGSPLADRLLVHTWFSGGGVGARRALEAFLEATDQPRIFLVNVEALSSVKAAREACANFLRSAPCMMVVDESTRLKTFNTARTRACLKLGELAVARRIMSGLPTPKSPLDLFSQFQFLDWRILGFYNYYAFRARYAVVVPQMLGGRSVQIVVGYKNQDELQARIAPYSYRVLKEDCLDLPAKVFVERPIELTEEQKRLYGSVRENATAQLNALDHITATTVITQILRLHQLLCGIAVDENGIEHNISETRTQALLDLLEEYPGKAIIWLPYRRALRRVVMALRQEYGELSTVDYYGDTSAHDRGEAVYRFQEDTQCRFFVGTPNAGGLGLTLTAANLVVFYANSWDLELRLQAEDRAHRAGLRHAVTYVDLVAPQTVDEKILKALRAKINLAAAITGDGWREWVR